MVIVALIVPDWPSVGVSQSHPMTELGTTMQGAVVGIVVDSSESAADPVTAPTATIWSETSTARVWCCQVEGGGCRRRCPGGHRVRPERQPAGDGGSSGGDDAERKCDTGNE